MPVIIDNNSATIIDIHGTKKTNTKDVISAKKPPLNK